MFADCTITAECWLWGAYRLKPAPHSLSQGFYDLHCSLVVSFPAMTYGGNVDASFFVEN